MINFKSIPFVRILLPYLIGILYIQWQGFFPHFHIVFLFVFVLLILAFLFQKFYSHAVVYKKITYIICLNAFLFLLAFETCYVYNAKNSVTHYSHFLSSNEQLFFCTVTDLPVNTGKFIKLTAEINFAKHNGIWNYSEGNTIIYLKNSVTQPIDIGECLMINAKFGYPDPPKNPNEFDYKSFLENRNIYNVVYTDSSEVFKTGKVSLAFSFTRMGCRIKEKVIVVMRSAGLSQAAFSICSALLVGYDDEIESSILTSFSHSGTLHVLSVSGMHTGVLYGLLVFLFAFFDKHNRYQKTKCFFIIGALCMFVFITGFSPSVLRAALMLALIILGKTFKKNGNSYNTLFFSAFLLLLVNPLLIKDVGFLLSYLAVLGIMYLYPVLMARYFIENKIIRWFWSLTLMSVAATVFTLPVSLFYFHQFPVWFIFSNLLVIPLSIVLMGASALLLVFYKVLFMKHLIVWLINSGTSVMLWFTQLTDQKPFGFIDYISFSSADVLFSIIFICLALAVISTKQYKTVFLFCVCIITWLCFSVLANYKEMKQKELVVFNLRHKSAYVLRLGHIAYIKRDELTEKEFQRFIKPYLLNFSGLKIIDQTGDILKHENTTILNINKPGQGIVNQSVTYMIVSHNTILPFKKTLGIKPPLVIADCSNSYTFVKNLKEECAAMDIPFYSVKEEGALRINF